MLNRVLTCVVLMMGMTVGQAQGFSDRPDVQMFIQEMVQKHQMNATQLQQWFAQFESSKPILELIAKPFERVTWDQYRKRFITEQRVQKGIEFWNQNRDRLRQASRAYGVPPEIIIAILGMETNYGQYQGAHPVLQALATLAFDYPPRSPFFRQELENFLLLCREQKLNPTELKGSYAGAMGMPQFVASSYRKFAVDCEQKGHADLMENKGDVIASVAHYFKQNGWATGEPIVHGTLRKGKKITAKIAEHGNPLPYISIAHLSQQGLVPKDRKLWSSNAKVAVLELMTTQGPEHWLGRNNFYVITRYNRSHNYAMAVYVLSEKLKTRIKES